MHLDKIILKYSNSTGNQLVVHVHSNHAVNILVLFILITKF